MAHTEALRATTERRKAPDGVVLDKPDKIAWYIRHITADAKWQAPVDGGGSHNRLIQLVFDGCDEALTPETMGDLLHEHWAPHFDRDWIDKRTNQQGQNEIGCG